MTAVVAPAGTSRQRLTGPLLIASEDGTSVAGALRLAQLLARRDGVHAHVMGPGRKPAPSRARAAEYILAGFPPAGARSRALDAAVSLAATAGVPVLAVPPGAESLPVRALVRMDFGEASMSAATSALALLDGNGSLTLASVVPGETGVLRRFAAAFGALGQLDVGVAVLPARDGLPQFIADYDLVVTAMGESAERAPEDDDMEAMRAAPGCVLIMPPRTDVGDAA
jgi:hypothetical protein